MEALNTGGIGARIPLITAMQEQSRAGTANALMGQQNQLSQAGLARTPFAASILGQTRLRGDQQTSLIPSQVASGMIGAAPQYAMAPVGAMISGAGSLANTQANQNIAKGNQETSLFTGLMSAAAGAAAAACWVARRLYGDTPDFYAARWFLLHQWQGRTANVVRWLYLRHGRQIAASRFVWLLRPAFALAVKRGRAL